MKATYNNDGIKNRFIEALPPMLSGEELAKTVSRYPSSVYDIPELGALPRTKRLVMTNQLLELYQPTSFTMQLYVQLYCAIQSAYLHQSKNAAGTPGFCFSVVGVSGIGKTRTLEMLLDLFPQYIEHENYNGTPVQDSQIVYIYVQTPHNSSVRSICLSILDEVDRISGSNYMEQYLRRRATTDILVSHISRICRHHHVGLIVIDEIQNARNRAGLNFLDFVVQLANSTKASICFVGTPLAVEPLEKQMRSARRATGFRLDPFRFDSEFNLVLDAIWRTQYLRQYQPLTDDLRKYLFDKCGGITDVLIKLLYYGQRRAIESGTEKLTVPLFEKVSNSILKMELDSMNKGLKESVSDVRWDIRNA
ncbi:MAG: ATP-binding protein [Blautia massiliensis (ex Durand et al. 2017)]